MHDTQNNPCAANICVSDTEPHLRTWYPDEVICTVRPMTKWIKKQRKIQKLFLAGKIERDRYFTMRILEDMYAVRKPEGINPERPVEEVAEAFTTPVKTVNQTIAPTKSYKESFRQLQVSNPLFSGGL